jgi:hypothetical protein
VVFLGLAAYYAYNYYNYLNMTRDSDGDGIPDVDELSKYHTNPNSRDTDSDGLIDYQEVFVYHTDPLKPDPNVKYAVDSGLEKYIEIVKPLDNDGVQDSNERQFVELMANSKKALDVPTFISYLREKASDGRITDEELKYSNNFASLVKGLYDEISKFYFIKNGQKVYIDDKINVTDYASDLGLRLGFDKNLASNATTKAIAYYGIAVRKDNLPEDFDAVSLLTKGTQIEKYGNNLVNFDPIVVKDAKGNVIVIESYDKGRDTWMIAHLLKQRPELVEQPKKFEWINRMMQQIAWNIFDDEYGPNSGWIEPTTGKRHLSENLTPTDERVWSIILGFHDYMDKLPSQMEKDNLPRFFHYEDSDLLEKQIPDKTNRTIALFYLAALPSVAYNRENYNYEIGSDGMLLFVKRLPQMYDWVLNAWKNLDSEEYKYAMVAYKMWLQDRFNHIPNTVKQFSGEWPFEQEGTIDDFLNKNFFAWKFAKFPYAYLRGRISYGPDFNIPDPNYSEAALYSYEVPLAYKSVGIPLGFIGGSPYIIGTMGGEWAVPLPDNIIFALKQTFSQSRIAIGYGNLIGMYSSVDGVEKDGMTEIFSGIRRITIYLWKKE